MQGYGVALSVPDTKDCGADRSDLLGYRSSSCRLIGVLKEANPKPNRRSKPV